MKKFLMIVGALLVCHSMQAQYFCTTPNAELHYVNYDEVGQSVSDVTAYVNNVAQSQTGVVADYLCKNVTTKAKNNTSYALLRWTYQGGKTVCAEDLLYGMYIADDLDPAKYDETARMRMIDEYKYKGDTSFTLADNLKAGQELPDRFYQIIDKMLKKTVNTTGISCMGNERISTTAGKFDCIKISYMRRTKVVLKSTNERVVEWYAKGVGLVKSETYDMKGRVAGKTLLVKIKK